MAEIAIPIATILSAGATAAGAYQSYQQGKKVRQANRESRARANYEHQVNVRRAIAQQRVEQARIQAMGVSSGNEAGSAVMGQTVAEGTQTASNIGVANQMFRYSSNIARTTGRAQAYGARAQAYGQLGQVFGSFSPFGTGLVGAYNAANSWLGRQPQGGQGG